MQLIVTVRDALVVVAYHSRQIKIINNCVHNVNDCNGIHVESVILSMCIEIVIIHSSTCNMYMHM